MRNQTAIYAAVLALAAAVTGLGWTIAQVLPDENEPDAHATAPSFTAVDVLPGQTKRSTMPDFIGPVQLVEKADTDQKVEPAPPKKAMTTAPARKRQQWKPAVLQVVTNFAQADVTVNGIPYPEYYEPGTQEGMVLPAGGPYAVEVTFSGNTKHYNLNLRPYETRLLLVELTGYKSGAPAPPPVKRPEPAKKEEPKKEDEKKEDGDGGQITVYSKPAGTVITDGKETGEKTPGTVDLSNGRHEIQVKYETGTVSEKKIVRVRNGSKIKLFFRERK